MGMLDRIKKRQNAGFKEFVMVMETSNPLKRGHIFTTGVLEDPVFMMHVMRNIKTFDDVLTLDSSELETVLNSQDQMIILFAKSICKDVSKVSDFSINFPKFYSRLNDQLLYIKDMSATEIEGARFYLVKSVRKLQEEERIVGFRWKLPPQNIYYPKQFKDGTAKIIFDNGVVAAEGMYRKGKRMGAWKHNYDNGNILAEGDYSDGQKEGSWTFYYSSGKLKGKGRYRSDLKHGTWQEWDWFGEMKEIEYFEGVKKE